MQPINAMTGLRPDDHCLDRQPSGTAADLPTSGYSIEFGQLQNGPDDEIPRDEIRAGEGAL